MIIYKITNKLNGRVYIGQTVRTLEYRWKQHCRAKDNTVFHKALRKYGPENFTVEQIDIACTLDELNKKEKYWIEYYHSVKDGYNMTEGGRSGAVDMKRSEKTKQKIADSIRGKKHWHATRVRNIETGEIFDTVSEAARKYNTLKTNIIGVCKGRAHFKTCKGYHWEYV